MLTINPNAVTPSVHGIDQQDWSEIQNLRGVYPYQVGLQKRIPAKTLQESFGQGIGSIYVFYLVYGRFYTFIDFGSIQIGEVKPPAITIPALPPAQSVWWDDFSGYTPDGLISMIWGGGDWLDGIGICETIIEGYFDPFLGGGFSPPETTIGPGGGIAVIDTPVDPTSPPYWYPPGLVNVYLHERLYSLWPGEGDETLPENGAANDSIRIYDYSDPLLRSLIDEIFASDLIVGRISIVYGLRIGRTPNLGSYDDKYSMGAPFEPHWNPLLPYPPPSSTIYSFTITTGILTVEQNGYP